MVQAHVRDRSLVLLLRHQRRNRFIRGFRRDHFPRPGASPPQALPERALKLREREDAAHPRVVVFRRQRRALVERRVVLVLHPRVVLRFLLRGDPREVEASVHRVHLLLLEVVAVQPVALAEPAERRALDLLVPVHPAHEKLRRFQVRLRPVHVVRVLEKEVRQPHARFSLGQGQDVELVFRLRDRLVTLDRLERVVVVLEPGR
eukprot:30497-Pelagococcus_subviridis.AAC.31